VKRWSIGWGEAIGEENSLAFLGVNSYGIFNGPLLEGVECFLRLLLGVG